MKRNDILIVGLLFASFAGATDVHFSGTVYDTAGKGIFGARVGLVKAGLTTRTEPDGQWTISGQLDSTRAALPDTLLIYRDGDSLNAEKITLSGYERLGVAVILKNHETQARSINAVGENGASDTAPSANLVAKSDSVKKEEAPKQERSWQDVNWEKPLEPQKFSMSLSFEREKYTGTYDNGIYWGAPMQYVYGAEFRIGLWKMKSGGYGNFEFGENFIYMNHDLEPFFDGTYLFDNPRMKLTVGVTPWWGGLVSLRLPWGDSLCSYSDSTWRWGIGAFISYPRGKFYVDGDARIDINPWLFSVNVKPQYSVKKWFGVYGNLSYSSGHGDREYDYPLDSWVFTTEPGVRLQMTPNTGIGIGVPFTVDGNHHAATWALKFVFHQTFGL